MRAHPDVRQDLPPFADLALARRLESAEGASSAAFVEARALLEPEVGAVWIGVGGARGIFDGVHSPLSQSFGLGMAGPVEDSTLDTLEAFFRERGATVLHEVSPLADPSLLGLFHRRGYRPVEFTSVLYRRLSGEDDGGTDDPGTPLRARRIEPHEADRWAAVAAEGWAGEAPELGEFMHAMGRITARARGSHAFLAELEGEPLAAGALGVNGGVALLAGASTIPGGRRRGAQRALLRARLRFAVEQGCDLAMMGALPGSGSQRNAERQGFRIAYTRVKWELPEG
jgi:hypothetical protein